MTKFNLVQFLLIYTASYVIMFCRLHIVSDETGFFFFRGKVVGMAGIFIIFLLFFLHLTTGEKGQMKRRTLLPTDQVAPPARYIPTVPKQSVQRHKAMHICVYIAQKQQHSHQRFSYFTRMPLFMSPFLFCIFVLFLFSFPLRTIKKTPSF